MADNLQQWGVPTNHIHYLPNGVDLERFEQFSEHRLEALRKQFNLAGKTVILFLGSLSLKSHPVDILLRAFAKLAPATQGLHLLIVGGGEDYDNLIALAKELHIDQQVGFVGRVPPEDAGYYYRLADISVDPIYNDASALGRSPLKLFESWACQVAFVTSKVGERERLMGDPPAGLFALPGDADDLALKLKRLAGDEMMRKELNQRGLTRLQDYSWSKLAQRAIEIYEQYV
jgi:glycosyltransferase involved in cell wall biosynthesis